MASVARQRGSHAVCFRSWHLEEWVQDFALFPDQCCCFLLFTTSADLKCACFISLIFCLLIYSASEPIITRPIPSSPSPCPSGYILVLMPSIDLSRLPFLLLSLSAASPLFNSIRLLFHLLPLPSYTVQSITPPPVPSPLLLPPYLLLPHFLSFFPPPLFHCRLSLFSALTLSPRPLSPTLSPSSLSPLSLGWLAEVSGSPTGHLSLSSQFHSLATLFNFVCLFYEWWPSGRCRRCCREQGSFAGSEKCVIMETPLIVPLLTPVVLGSLNCFPSDGAEALHRVTMGLHPCWHVNTPGSLQLSRIKDTLTRCVVWVARFDTSTSRAKYPWKLKKKDACEIKIDAAKHGAYSYSALFYFLCSWNYKWMWLLHNFPWASVCNW